MVILGILLCIIGLIILISGLIWRINSKQRLERLIVSGNQKIGELMPALKETKASLSDIGVDGVIQENVTVMGTPQVEKPLVSPISGTPCLYYKYKVTLCSIEHYTETKKDSNGNETLVEKTKQHKDTLDNGECCVPSFVINDGTGTITIEPQNESFEALTKTVDKSESNFSSMTNNDVFNLGNLSLNLNNGYTPELIKYTEEIVGLDRNITVIGTVCDNMGDFRLRSSGKSKVIISTKSADDILADTKSDIQTTGFMLITSAIGLLIGLSLAIFGGENYEANARQACLNQDPLFCAQTAEVANLFISEGSNINAVGNNGYTPLHTAASNGYTDVVTVLINAGVDVNAIDNNGNTPLHLAARNNHKEVAKQLIGAGADYNLKNNAGKLAYDVALDTKSYGVSMALPTPISGKATQEEIDPADFCVRALNQDPNAFTKKFSRKKIRVTGRVSNVKPLPKENAKKLGGNILLAMNDDGSNTFGCILKKAPALNITNGDTILVEGKGDVLTITVEGEMGAFPILDNCKIIEKKDTVAAPTPAPATQEDALFNAAADGNIDVVRELISTGVNANVKINTNIEKLIITPIGNASAKGHTEIVKLLIDAGADADSKSEALRKAAVYGHLEIVKMLIAAGANIHYKSAYDRTALHEAAQNGYLDVVKTLIAAGANVNAVDVTNSTTLQYAVALVDKANVEVVKTLIEAGANVNNANAINGYTALISAASSRKPDIVQTLIRAGADVNAQDKFQNTPLIMATLAKNKESVKALVYAGANINAQDHEGNTAIIHASLHDKPPFELTKLLASLGANPDIKNNNGLSVTNMLTDPSRSEILRVYANRVPIQVQHYPAPAPTSAPAAPAPVQAEAAPTPEPVATADQAVAAAVQAVAAPIPESAPVVLAPIPEPAPAPGIDVYKGKRCDVQTISNEKHLPNWNIEIVDASAIAPMLKDAEKAHLPFIKINASDDLKQKLEDYINKNPSKLNIAPGETISCELGQYIKTASNIGIQHVLCDNSESTVEFLNLVSPVDNNARVYKTKTFDHLFEDAPAIDKFEETVINGERGAYVAVKYVTAFDATGTESTETDIVNYLFLGDKLRYLTDWNAFHINETSQYAEDNGKESYSCNAKATLLRLESTGAKEMTHTFAIGK